MRDVSASFMVARMNDDLSPSADLLPAQPGHRLARGVARMLLASGHAPLLEFVPAPGLRVDVISVAPSGEIWIVECKSCRADFVGDRKWQGYLEWCDRCLLYTSPSPRDRG